MTVLKPCWASAEAKLRQVNVLPSEGMALVKRKLRYSDSLPNRETEARSVRKASACSEPEFSAKTSG